MKTFYWSKFLSGDWYLFDRPRGQPRTPIGAGYKGTKRAAIWRDGVELSFASGGNDVAARRNLEKTLDKRSIDLFGEDDIAFVKENC